MDENHDSITPGSPRGSKEQEEEVFSFPCGAEVVLDPLAIHDPRVVSVVEYVANNPGESLTLKRLGEKFQCSPEHLSRLLKEKLRIGFREFSREIRMTIAGILLEAGWAVRLVAFLMGWKSVEGFIRCFKRCFDITPKTFQKESFHWKRVPSPKNGKRNFPWTIIQPDGNSRGRFGKELYHIPIFVKCNKEALWAEGFRQDDRNQK